MTTTVTTLSIRVTVNLAFPQLRSGWVSSVQSRESSESLMVLDMVDVGYNGCNSCDSAEHIVGEHFICSNTQKLSIAGNSRQRLQEGLMRDTNH